ncbi:hypothetical protein QUF55_03340 [Clostridiaceae bacterium HSG29]|nr:hypothetical protein [Clostridiaceae bacterium HSG29]
MRTVMGIEIQNREESAVKVQELLTKHGCIIKTRLGLHEVQNQCSASGFILLEFERKETGEHDQLKNELNTIENVVAKTMEF